MTGSEWARKELREAVLGSGRCWVSLIRGGALIKNGAAFFAGFASAPRPRRRRRRRWSIDRPPSRRPPSQLLPGLPRLCLCVSWPLRSLYFLLLPVFSYLLAALAPRSRFHSRPRAVAQPESTCSAAFKWISVSNATPVMRSAALMSSSSRAAVRVVGLNSFMSLNEPTMRGLTACTGQRDMPSTSNGMGRTAQAGRRNSVTRFFNCERG